MSTEIISPSDAAAAQEYPDRIGFKPDNPFLATFRPYIPAGVSLRELTPLPLVMGTLLGIVFGASSLYLVLKVGLTVSASIPVAVLSITIFRVLSKLSGARTLKFILMALILLGGGLFLYYLTIWGVSPLMRVLEVVIAVILIWIIWQAHDATILENNI